MLLVFTILAVLGILVGAAFLATYEGEVLRDPHPDDRDAELPPGAVQPEDVAELRFDLALRGYRMAEVDRVLHRLAGELAARDTRIAELEQALVDSRDAAPPAPADSTPAEPEPTYAPPPVDVPPVTDVQPEPPAPEPEPVPEPVLPPVVEEEPAPAAPETFEPLEPPAAAPATLSGPLTATTWFSEPAPVPEPVDVPEPTVAEPTVPEPELTLPASDDAFSFPELTPPPPAEEATQDEPGDWWAQLQERPSGEGTQSP